MMNITLHFMHILLLTVCLTNITYNFMGILLSVVCMTDITFNFMDILLSDVCRMNITFNFMDILLSAVRIVNIIFPPQELGKQIKSLNIVWTKHNLTSSKKLTRKITQDRSQSRECSGSSADRQLDMNLHEKQEISQV